MQSKGFTLIELMIVVAIIGMSIAVFKCDREPKQLPDKVQWVNCGEEQPKHETPSIRRN